MFTSVRVLIVEEDIVSSRDHGRAIEAQGFSVKIARTVSDALDEIGEHDILLIDTSVNGGTMSSDIVLEKWIEKRRGPMCVISDRIQKCSDCEEYFVGGAHNVFPKPISAVLLSSAMMRYGMEVMTRNMLGDLGLKVQNLEATIKKQTKTIRVLIILIILMQGYNLGPDIYKWMIGLII